ncbi:WbqC family protein [Xanthomarina sp. F2636L]|uniref:WbqC family protein n=1 Tax=Xanthomarina sp. F2636L TaxID=2996018 RepID=UPI00225E49DB|nr:WbqC family protein [Xanthomarina sp. F2636L]MCX7550033.1 WbqC family protein [Xanthomarina sp. F2636L]
MDVLIHPTYFPNIAHVAAMVQSDQVTFEMDDNYQKQTYRNRTYIYGANGNLQLSIPIIHTQKERQKYRDIKIYNNESWQAIHWKSIETAYRTSPFFEFYEDDFQPLFTKKAEKLLDFNMACLDVIFDCLQLELNSSKTKIYEKSLEGKTDFRHLTNARKEPLYNFDFYMQVFNDKHGFISNLSVLDLLFNEGPNASIYLENQFKHI